MASARGPLLTIGQAAAYAGVTVRAVRHYHQIGLLAEPDRDASGYRRYNAGHVIELIRIRALAEAGVPLSRVAELLKASDEDLAEAVTEIDDNLQAEIARLEEHRHAVAQLATVDGLALPQEVADYLDLLRSFGLSDRMIRVERDGWLLIAASAPDAVVDWIAEKRASFDQPEIVDFYRNLDKAMECEPDDPFLEEVADQLADLFERYYEAFNQEPPGAPEPGLDETTVAMLDAGAMGVSPAMHRLEQLLQERGWTNWNDVGPPQRIT
jgi:DNA-binding transcriptional MerR regulator